MFDYIIKKGTTSKIIQVSLYDSSSTTGAKLAGLVFDTSSLTVYYNRNGASGAATAISLVTATKGTWTSGGFIAIDGTNMPGDYELHLPNAVLVAGAEDVLIQIKGATNLVPKNISIKLVDNEEVDTYARIGAAGVNLTALGDARFNYLDANISTIMSTQVVEGSYTYQQAMRIILSILAGKLSGGGTVTLKFRDTADSKDRVTATVDSNENRTAITLDVS